MAFTLRPSALSSVADQVWKTTKDQPSVSDGTPFASKGMDIFGSSSKTTTCDSTSAAASSVGKFIFGQDLTTKAIVSEDALTHKDDSTTTTASHNALPAASSSFDALAKEECGSVSPPQSHQPPTQFNPAIPTLADAPAPSAVLGSSLPVSTGEEGESNVLQVVCKLYMLDNNEWLDRGKGVLRLNDSSDGCRSRIVIRSEGTGQRLLLNSALTPSMFVQRAGEKQLRFSAVEEGKLRMYLITCANFTHLGELERAMQKRIGKLKQSEATKAKSSRKRPDNSPEQQPSDEKRKRREDELSESDSPPEPVPDSTSEAVATVQSSKECVVEQPDSVSVPDPDCLTPTVVVTPPCNENE